MNDPMIVGIDPGKDGGICVMCPNNIELIRMPKGDYSEVALKLRDILGEVSGSIFIEDVHAIYGSAAKSTFNFGKIVGITLGCCWSQGLEVTQIQPKAWQKAIRIDEDIVLKDNGRKDTKACSLNAANRLYPDVDKIPKRGRKPHDGLVDALLIAHYGLLHHSI